MAPPNSCPLATLPPDQLMLIWAFRLWVGDRDNWRLVTRHLQYRYGDAAGQRAVRGLATMISALRQHATRQIRHYPDGAPLLTADERLLANAFSCAQHGADPMRACAALLSERGWPELRSGLADLVAVLSPIDLSFRRLAAAE